MPFQQLAPKKSMGKKYMQEQNIFKQKFQQPKKQHRQIVMSQEFIRSSKIYRLLKEKMDRCDSMFIKEVNALNQQKIKLKEENMHLKSQNYHEKIGLWELKNKLMELKSMYQEEQEQSRRLGEQNYGEYEGQMQNDQQQMEQSQQNEQQFENEANHLEKQQQQSQKGNQGIQKQELQQNYLNKQKNPVEDRNHFSQILQELMNLKAERNRMEKQFSQQIQMPQKELTQSFELKQQYFNDNIEQN